MESRLNIIDIKTWKVTPESQRQMVLTIFKKLGTATDWEVKNELEKQYNLKIDERNWVSARRGDLVSEGLIEPTELKRPGDFGKPCTVWCFNADGKKKDPECLTSNQMNRVIKYLSDKGRIANSYQIKQMIEVLKHYDKELS